MITSSHRRQQLTAKAEKYAINIDKADEYLASRGISEETADLFGLGVADAGSEAGRLSIPYLTPNGVIHIKYRCIQMHDCRQVNCPKYLSEAGLGSHLFNARALIGAGDIAVLTEGEMDAISVQSATDIPSIGYPGVKNWKPSYRLCFEGVREVLVIADGDDPGRKSAATVASRLGMIARVVDLGDGMDSNKYLTEHGPEKFAERLRA